MIGIADIACCSFTHPVFLRLRYGTPWYSPPLPPPRRFPVHASPRVHLAPPILIPLPACCGHGSVTCYTAPTSHRQLPSRRLPSSVQLTNTFLALQMRHARLRTLPSACTTSGANSMPNLSLVSHLDTDIKYAREQLTCFAPQIQPSLRTVLRAPQALQTTHPLHQAQSPDHDRSSSG
jgi:hypothetical protein